MKEDKYYLNQYQLQELERILNKVDNAFIELETLIAVLKHPARIKDDD